MTLARYLIESLRSLWVSPCPAATAGLSPDACPCSTAASKAAAAATGLLASSCPASGAGGSSGLGKAPPPSGPLDIPSPSPRLRSLRSHRTTCTDAAANADARPGAAPGLEGGRARGARWPQQDGRPAPAANACPAVPDGAEEDATVVAKVLDRMQQLLQVTSMLECKVGASRAGYSN